MAEDQYALRAGGRRPRRIRVRRAAASTTLRILISVLAGVLSTGAAVSASAATLGGLQTADLGAAHGGVQAHPDGVIVNWSPAFEGVAPVVGGVTVSAVAPDSFVAGEQLRVAFVAASGAAACEVAATVATAAPSLQLSRAEIESACGGSMPFSALDRIAVAFGS